MMGFLFWIDERQELRIADSAVWVRVEVFYVSDTQSDGVEG